MVLIMYMFTLTSLIFSGCATVPPSTSTPFAQPALVYQRPQTEVAATLGGDTLGGATLSHVRPLTNKRALDVGASFSYAYTGVSLGYWLKRKNKKPKQVRGYRFGLTGGAGSSSFANIGMLNESGEIPNVSTALQNMPDSFFIAPSINMQWTRKLESSRVSVYGGLSVGIPLTTTANYFESGSANPSLSLGARLDKEQMFIGGGFQTFLMGIPLPIGVLGYRF